MKTQGYTENEILSVSSEAWGEWAYRGWLLEALEVFNLKHFEICIYNQKKMYQKSNFSCVPVA